MKARIKVNASSGYKGVFAKNNKYQVKINIPDKELCLGTYDDAITAAMVYDYYCLQYDKPVVNFPELDYSNFEPPRKKEKQKPSYTKLGLELANSLRLDNANGMTPKALSEKYNITLAAVYRILNNVTYRINRTDVMLGGTSIVEVIYNPKTNVSIADRILGF